MHKIFCGSQYTILAQCDLKSIQNRSHNKTKRQNEIAASTTTTVEKRKDRRKKKSLAMVRWQVLKREQNLPIQNNTQTDTHRIVNECGACSIALRSDYRYVVRISLRRLSIASMLDIHTRHQPHLKRSFHRCSSS